MRPIFLDFEYDVFFYILSRDILVMYILDISLFLYMRSIIIICYHNIIPSTSLATTDVYRVQENKIDKPQQQML